MSTMPQLGDKAYNKKNLLSSIQNEANLASNTNASFTDAPAIDTRSSELNPNPTPNMNDILFLNTEQQNQVSMFEESFNKRKEYIKQKRATPGVSAFTALR